MVQDICTKNTNRLLQLDRMADYFNKGFGLGSKLNCFIIIRCKMLRGKQHLDCFFGCVEIHIPNLQPQARLFLIVCWNWMKIYTRLRLMFVINVLYLIYLPSLVYFVSRSLKQRRANWLYSSKEIWENRRESNICIIVNITSGFDERQPFGTAWGFSLVRSKCSFSGFVLLRPFLLFFTGAGCAFFG